MCCSVKMSAERALWGVGMINIDRCTLLLESIEICEEICFFLTPLEGLNFKGFLLLSGGQ